MGNDRSPEVALILLHGFSRLHAAIVLWGRLQPQYLLTQLTQGESLPGICFVRRAPSRIPSPCNQSGVGALPLSEIAGLTQVEIAEDETLCSCSVPETATVAC
jgi:hypothetical protein